MIVKAWSTFLEVSELTCGVTPMLVAPNPPLIGISRLHMKAFDSSVMLPNAFRGACAVTVGGFKGDDEVSELCCRENLIAMMAFLSDSRCRDETGLATRRVFVRSSEIESWLDKLQDKSHFRLACLLQCWKEDCRRWGAVLPWAERRFVRVADS
jgi:hypothetical protein